MDTNDGKGWIHIADLRIWPIRSCLYLLTGVGLWTLLPLFSLPLSFPLPPSSLSIKLPPLVPPRTRGWVIYLGVAPDGIDWCDMNNTPTELLFCQSTCGHGLDETHGFLQFINLSNFFKLVLDDVNWSANEKRTCIKSFLYHESLLTVLIVLSSQKAVLNLSLQNGEIHFTKFKLSYSQTH